MSEKRALITGITGQDGSYLAELLLQLGYTVYGLIRRTTTVSYERIKHIQDRIGLISGDLTDLTSLIYTLREVQPQEVYNLAAQSFVPASWQQPVLTGDVTALGVTRLLDAIRTLIRRSAFTKPPAARCSARCRQFHKPRPPPFYPRSPYGVAKVYGHWITVNYRESYGLHATSGILFNHESPRRGYEFVTRKVSRHAAMIKLGLIDEIRIGNLDAQRDWGFAGDYVLAMWKMLQQPTPDDYVIATNRTHSVEYLCEQAFACVGLNWRDYAVQDSRFMRPAEVDLLIGDYTKAKTQLDWEPTTSFEQLVEMMVKADYDRIKTEHNL